MTLYMGDNRPAVVRQDAWNSVFLPNTPIACPKCGEEIGISVKIAGGEARMEMETCFGRFFETNSILGADDPAFNVSLSSHLTRKAIAWFLQESQSRCTGSVGLMSEVLS